MARKSPLAFIYAQIKADNPSLNRFLADSNCQVSTPVALSGDASGKNTSITVTGIATKGFKDTATFKYNRVGLADIIAASTTGNTTNIVPNTSQSTLADMIASFNTAYGSNLQASDVQSTTIGQLTGGYYGLTLTPTDGHYLFNGAAQIKFKGTFVTLTLAGTLTGTATNGTPYSSSLTISGGSGNYSNPRVASGTLPAGLSLSISGSTVVLSGNPGTTGTKNIFTVAVDSDDGQTATSATQTILANGGDIATLASKWPTTTFTGVTLTDLKASV